MKLSPENKKNNNKLEMNIILSYHHHLMSLFMSLSQALV